MHTGRAECSKLRREQSLSPGVGTCCEFLRKVKEVSVVGWSRKERSGGQWGRRDQRWHHPEVQLRTVAYILSNWKVGT